MYEQQRVAVVVPAYDEERHVGRVIETMPAFVDRIYAVDDSSTDRTWEVIRAHAVRDPATAARADGGPRVVPIRHEQNLGAGAAVVTGYRRALADEMDVVAVMDGDGQMDPNVLDRIVAPVAEGRAGYAKGDRLSRPELWAGMSRWRTFGNVLLTQLTRISTGYWRLSDAQNGYTAISADALDRLPLEDLYDRYGFLNDLLARLNELDVTVADVPHEAVYGSEESGISYPSFVPRLSTLLAVNFLRRIAATGLVREFHPFLGCYLIGALGLLAGVPTAAALSSVSAVFVVAALSVFLLMQGLVFDWRRNADLSLRIGDAAADRNDAPLARN